MKVGFVPFTRYTVFSVRSREAISSLRAPTAEDAEESVAEILGVSTRELYAVAIDLLPKPVRTRRMPNARDLS